MKAQLIWEDKRYGKSELNLINESQEYPTKLYLGAVLLDERWWVCRTVFTNHDWQSSVNTKKGAQDELENTIKWFLKTLKD